VASEPSEQDRPAPPRYRADVQLSLADFYVGCETGRGDGQSVADLEFGRELPYFREKGATAKDGLILKGKKTTSYTIQLVESQLLLFTSGTPERPIAVAWQHADRRRVYWYDSYEEILFDAKLFAKPDDVKVENGK
jgi:hypothetical protein